MKITYDMNILLIISLTLKRKSNKVQKFRRSLEEDLGFLAVEGVGEVLVELLSDGLGSAVTENLLEVSGVAMADSVDVENLVDAVVVFNFKEDLDNLVVGVVDIRRGVGSFAVKLEGLFLDLEVVAFNILFCVMD